MSAWIEINVNTHWGCGILVALFVSAWIEIANYHLLWLMKTSRTLCECVDWNKDLEIVLKLLVQSHSLWVRGLKSLKTLVALAPLVSHSLWVRGLKFYSNLENLFELVVALFVSAWIEINIKHSIAKTNPVALFVSAWIEISTLTLRYDPPLSRTPCECVDWNLLNQSYAGLIISSHSLWVRGLK